MKKLLTAIAITLTAGIALAQDRNPTEDAIASQIGQLVIQNNKLSAMVQALGQQVAELKKKCGKPCEPEDKPAAPTPPKP